MNYDSTSCCLRFVNQNGLGLNTQNGLGLSIFNGNDFRGAQDYCTWIIDNVRCILRANSNQDSVVIDDIASVHILLSDGDEDSVGIEDITFVHILLPNYDQVSAANVHNICGILLSDWLITSVHDSTTRCHHCHQHSWCFFQDSITFKLSLKKAFGLCAMASEYGECNDCKY